MKTVYAGYHIQTVIGKWKALAVTLNPTKLVAWQRPSQSMIQHVTREVDPQNTPLKAFSFSRCAKTPVPQPTSSIFKERLLTSETLNSSI